MAPNLFARLGKSAAVGALILIATCPIPLMAFVPSSSHISSLSLSLSLPPSTAASRTRTTQVKALDVNAALDMEVPTWLVDAWEQAKTVDTSQIQTLLNSALTPGLIQAIALFGLAGSLLYWLKRSDGGGGDDDQEQEAPYQPGTFTYDPVKAAAFYEARPGLVLKRILRLALLTSSFNAGILFDWLVLGKLLKDEEYTALKKAEPARAKMALRLIEQLGPTFIKLGQALSIRTDLIPAAYALELRQLQDAVPPFDSATARQVLQQDLAVDDLSDIFSSLSSEPVASASIGQVYKGTLRSTGQEVAVKVQRPGILAEIALDLHVLRVLMPIQTTLQNAVNGVATSQADIDLAVALVDEWGRGFVAETDYRLEAQNTMDFAQAMKDRGLDAAVCAPTVIPQLVTDRVLVTEWVQGTRLDVDKSPDVPRLCGVAINAYLTMLLDTGVLHCDPHPGNLLRTTDGKLCVLDWGMTLAVPPNLQYALLELIAHINVQNFDAIPQDFINLGFSPQGVTSERLKQSGITEGLTFAFRQLSAGGGPKKIQERVKKEFQDRYGSDLSDTELRNAARAEMLQRMEAQLESEGVDVKGVTNIMEEMSKRNRELFQLPPYVLYVARAFSTLEGIGLSVDENYSIVQECYPYLARRLFTDRSPRAKRALRAMLGLSEEAEENMHTAILSLSSSLGRDVANGRQSSSSSSSSSSALAIVQAGAARGATLDEKEFRGGNLSLRKLIEMSEGFASYTAATANVDRDGAGRDAAVAEFVKLLLDPKGSTLQDILIEEVARLSDAATRTALRAIFLENPAARLTRMVLTAPKQLVEQSLLHNYIPGPLKQALLDRPAQLPKVLESLFSTNVEDEKVLATATDVARVLTSQMTAGSQEGGANSLWGDPKMQEQARAALRSLLADEASRKQILEQLPGVAAASRRLAAGLLRRAAYRTDLSDGLPSKARNAIINTNRRLAKAIDMNEHNENGSTKEP